MRPDRQQARVPSQHRPSKYVKDKFVSRALIEDVKAAWTEQAAQPLYVLKFGGSVLQTTADLPRVAGEVYRHRRAGRAVIAVVSALAGETDRLCREATSVMGLSSCRGVPDLVSLGGQRTVALLRLACDRIGLRAEICEPRELGLRTSGDAMAAHPLRLESEALYQILSRTGVVIVPGFVGLDDAGERTLLGCGGSDFSAIFIGGELKAACVRLYKDVDGVFEQDPALCAEARRFSEPSWADKLRIARPLIQPRAVEYAAAKNLPVEVEMLGSGGPTLVGSYSSTAQPVSPPRPLRISLAGYGVVGQALAERLQREPAFEIAAILVRNPYLPRAVAPPVPVTTSREEFLSSPAHIIVDAISCEETGSLLCNTVLPAGVHVVSASKRVISAHHTGLAAAALQGGSQLLYSAAVGGSAAVLETIDRARSKGEIVEVVGVLNGTVNFVLQRLGEGLEFEEALREAREKGFAEESAEADLSGADAAAKLRLIAHRAVGVDPSTVNVSTERLDANKAEEVRASRERWVQVGTLTRRDGGIRAAVRLQPLREVGMLPNIVDEWNCAAVKLHDGSIYRCIGRGAGGAATAEAIVADLYELLEERAATVRLTR